MTANNLTAPRVNELGQPIGFALPDWQAPTRPPRELMKGRYCRLEPLDASKHARDIFEAQAQDTTGSTWTYHFNGPYPQFAPFEEWCKASAAVPDKIFFAIVVDGKALGYASYMRMEPAHGCIEVGNIHFSPSLSRTRAATEAIFLMAAKVFDMGYRRFEWKCDSCNLPSRAAAARFGFTFEGTFRQAIVNKGRNRDTCWFAIIDQDWPALRQAYLQWLEPGNFDAAGKQRLRLSELTAP